MGIAFFQHCNFFFPPFLLRIFRSLVGWGSNKMWVAYVAKLATIYGVVEWVPSSCVTIADLSVLCPCLTTVGIFSLIHSCQVLHATIIKQLEIAESLKSARDSKTKVSDMDGHYSR